MKPTTAELEILSILWERGAATVKEVHEAIGKQKPALYTTVLKHLQIMQDKGLVLRDEHNKAHIYRAAVAKGETQKNLVSDMLQRVFRGSAAQLVQHVLEAKPASADELKEIKKMIRIAENAAEQAKKEKAAKKK
jgi:BlaI family penicillinase repressor